MADEPKTEELKEPLSVIAPNPVVVSTEDKVKTSNLEDDLGILGSSTDVGFAAKTRVYLSANQTITGVVLAKLQFNTVLYDPESHWDAANYRFGASNSGYYYVVAQVACDIGNFAVRICYDADAGIRANHEVPATATDRTILISDIIRINTALDFGRIWINVQNYNAGNLNIIGSEIYTTYLAIHKLSNL